MTYTFQSAAELADDARERCFGPPQRRAELELKAAEAKVRGVKRKLAVHPGEGEPEYRRQLMAANARLERAREHVTRLRGDD